MQTVQQDVMCALLQILLEKTRITRDVYDKARERILEKQDWPEFFGHAEDDREGDLNGSA